MNSDVLDILIVGAGPAGTAAAFRAHEIGLKALVVDLDEALSLLKDWMSPDGDASKDKLVDASFGPGGKAVPFPCGGELIERLVFGDRTPASQLYHAWTGVFADRGLQMLNGVEMTGLTVGDGGLLRAACVRAATREKPVFTTKHIVLAMGRGMPTKLEMPGDAAGIGYKLRDPQRYVGRPACVIGGGTSAAEAVIALSNAKAAANDNTDVFWSYRKRNLPKVNSTLAKEFFAAFSGNGNIRYLPFSEPVAVLRAADGSEFFALRSDRREVNGRPTEGTFLEFPKEQVLACIGADLPLQFLETIGVRQFVSADDDERYMAVTPWLETQVANVFMVGELLTPAFIQTRDFNPEVEQSTVIDHIGNFKRSMLDAVLAVEAIGARLSGRTDDELATLMDVRFTEFKERHAARGSAVPAAAGTAPVAMPVAPPPPQIGARLVRLSGGEPVDATRELLVPGRYVVGRSSGHFTFPGDESIVDNHAAILVEPEACYVSVDGMQGRVLVRVAVERTIEVGDVIWAGQQKVRLESMNGRLMLAMVGTEGEFKAWPVTEEGRSYGRQASARGIAIDADDKSLSRRHFFLQSAGNVVKLRDYGSINGTYLEVQGTLRLNEGDVVFVADPLLRFLGMQTAAKQARQEAASGAVAADAAAAGRTVVAAARPGDTMVPSTPPAKKAAPPVPDGGVKPAPAKAAARKEPAAEGAADGPPSLTLEPIGEKLAIAAGQTVLDRLIEAKLATKKPAEITGKVQMLYDCKGGTCGKCVLQVLGGEASISKLTGKDKRTINLLLPELAASGRTLDLDKCRLACRATVTGPVVLGLLGDTETAE